jgi:benzylsuccinate CoA-transferase BbsE subunit
LLHSNAGHSLLNGCRVLDLADEQGVYCGRVLADMGADVVKVEPPAGDPDRRIGPWLSAEPDDERGAWWLACNAGKRSVTLNLESHAGRVLFRRLAAEADIVVESFAPGCMDGLHIGYSALEAKTPALIYVSITPYGSEGPYARYRGSDLTALAMGGLMFSQGDGDRSPVGFSLPQASLHAGVEGAAGALFAYIERQQSGRGQFVDVSTEEAVNWTLMNIVQFWDVMGLEVTRGGAQRRRPDGARIRVHWPCKDGYVTFMGRNDYQGLAAWMRAEGFSSDAVLDRDWSTVTPWALTQDDIDRLESLVGPFFAQRTMEDLYAAAIKWRFILYPVYTVGDLLNYSQLREREFFVQVADSAPGETLTYPGSFVKTSEATPRVQGRAPRLGEHNRAVYQGELGFSNLQLTALRRAGAV